VNAAGGSARRCRLTPGSLLWGLACRCSSEAAAAYVFSSRDGTALCALRTSWKWRASKDSRSASLTKLLLTVLVIENSERRSSCFVVPYNRAEYHMLSAA